MIETIRPGSATSFLGHKTPGLAQRHYIDARQLAILRPAPPSPVAAEPYEPVAIAAAPEAPLESNKMATAQRMALARKLALQRAGRGEP
jgi:hypothetical protein